jgi:F-type H+-transporting ATPase subunit gamma
MTSLRDIKRQLKSVENIKKITDAMERVAAVHLKKAIFKAEQAIPYILKMKELLQDLSQLEFSHPLLEPKEEIKKTGVIVVTSDKGLTGSYNSNVISKAENFLKDYAKENVDMFIFGSKGLSYFKAKNWNVKEQYLNWGGKLSFQSIQKISNQLVHDFLSGGLDEIFLIYTHYISVSKREVVVEKFLNIGKPKSETNNSRASYILEPNTKEIFAEIIPRFCVAKIQSALNESYAAELAARILAMQAASKNSSELIEKLTLIKNKVRQRDITREMIEITSGVEGLK